MKTNIFSRLAICTAFVAVMAVCSSAQAAFILQVEDLTPGMGFGDKVVVIDDNSIAITGLTAGGLTVTHRDLAAGAAGTLAVGVTLNDFAFQITTGKSKAIGWI